MYFSGTSASVLTGGTCRSGIRCTDATNTDIPTGQSDGLRSANVDDQLSLGHRVMVSVSTKYLNGQRHGGVAPPD